eukprot:3859593-Pyramimonas_sp.AAC.2
MTTRGSDSQRSRAFTCAPAVTAHKRPPSTRVGQLSCLAHIHAGGRCMVHSRTFGRVAEERLPIVNKQMNEYKGSGRKIQWRDQRRSNPTPTISYGYAVPEAPH